MTTASDSKRPVPLWLVFVVGFGFMPAVVGFHGDCLAQTDGSSRKLTADSQASTSRKKSPSRKSSESQSRVRKFAGNQVLESDDWTFRPTVLVRRGTSQGSGTIVASVDGESLVLTASHVLRGTGPITIELHRYNMGLEHLSNSDGLWPRVIDGNIVASDTSADIALLKIRTRHALPYVARLGSGDIDPAEHEEMTSLGIDLGTKLSSWSTKLVEVFSFELNERGADRPFLVTAKIPEHGRSGGGLFDQDNRLVGVCVGHAELAPGKRMGVFSSVDNVHTLLKDHRLTGLVDRSESRRAHLVRSSAATSRHLSRAPHSHSAVTPTWSRDEVIRSLP